MIIVVQVKAELEKTKEQCEGLRNDLNPVSVNLVAKLATLTKKEDELQILHSCLSKVTEQAAATTTADNDVVDGGAYPSSAGGESVDGEQEGEAVGEKIQVQLEKVQAMLNTTKVIKILQRIVFIIIIICKSIISLAYLLCSFHSDSARPL